MFLYKCKIIIFYRIGLALLSFVYGLLLVFIVFHTLQSHFNYQFSKSKYGNNSMIEIPIWDKQAGIIKGKEEDHSVCQANKGFWQIAFKDQIRQKKGKNLANIKISFALSYPTPHKKEKQQNWSNCVNKMDNSNLLHCSDNYLLSK